MPLSPEELHTLRVECYLDPTLFARTFARHWFTSPMGWAHRGMLALLLGRADFLLNFGEENWPDSGWVWDREQLEKILRYFTYKEDFDSEVEVPKPLFVLSADGKSIHMVNSRFTALMLPRGIGKTTVVNLANLIDIVYKDVRFLMYLSETATHAAEQLENIKRELEGNELISEIFGNLQPDRSSGLHWSSDFIQTTHGVTVTAKGRGGQVRGKNVGGLRPDKIVVDDVEDDESVKTEEQLRKTKVWFWKGVVPALPKMSKAGRIVAMGTMLSPDALLPEMIRDPSFVGISFGAMDPEYYATEGKSGDSIAPFYMSREQYERERLSYARRGMLLEFEMEYASRIYHDEDSRKFDISKIKIEVMTRTQFIGVAEVIDPAISEERKADYTTIGITGMTDQGRHHVLDLWAKIGASPREQIDKYFDMHFQWSPTHHGVETIAYQAALVHLLQEEMFRRAKTFGPQAYFEIQKITHGRSRKEVRVEGILSPRYAAGYISHQRHFPELITQLRDWPLGKKDAPDVISMCVALLDPFAATAAFDGEVGDDGLPIGNPLVKNQYQPLGRWRRAP